MRTLPMIRSLSIILFTILPLFSTAHALQYRVAEPMGINISKEIHLASQEFLKSKLKDLDKDPNSDQKLEVQLKIIRFTTRATVHVEVKDAKGQVVWQDQTSIAHPDDLEKALTILSRSIVNRQKTQARDDIGLISDAEAEPYNKRIANKQVEVFLGSKYIAITGKEKDQVTTDVGVAWLYDTRDLIAGFDLVFGSNDSKTNTSKFGIFALYPLSQERNSLYLGGGLDYLRISHEGTAKSGLGVTGKVGYILGRSNSVHIRLDAGLTAPLYKIKGASLAIPSFSMGVGF